MEHNLNTNKYYASGIEISENEYKKRTKYLLEVRQLSVAVANAEMSINDVPTEYREKVRETVAIMQTPSLEQSDDELTDEELGRMVREGMM